MRSILWFTVGFALSLLAGISYWESNSFMLAFCFALPFLIFTIVSFRYGLLKLTYRIALGIMVGVVVLLSWKVFYWDELSHIDGETLNVSIEASGYSEESTYGYQVEGIVRFNGRPFKAVVYIDEDLNVEPGDYLRGYFRFRCTIPKGLKDNSYYRSCGVFLLASAKKDVTVLHAQKLSLKYFPAVVARSAKDKMAAVFPADVLSFAKALMLGDTTDLDYATDTALKVSGIRHIVAVSGLHVGMLYVLISLLVGHKRFLRLLLGTPCLILFAACAGFSPSVTRACIVMILMMLSEALRMEYDPLTELAFAISLMLATNPFMVESVSFRLSVFSVVGIILCSGKLRKALNAKFRVKKPKSLKARMVRGAVNSVSLSVGAMFLTIPLSLYYFGTVCLVGVLSNFLVIWLLPFIFFGVLFATGLGFFSVSGGAFVAKATAVLMRLVLLIARLISKIPYACLYIQNPWTVYWVVLSYGLIFYFLIFRRGKRLLFAICAGSLAFTILLGAYRPWTDDFRLSVLDVGQGQSILLQSNGKTFIVDCGSYNAKTAADRTAQTLLSQSIFSVDGLIVTHMDADHSGGVENLLNRIKVKTLYLPELDGDWRDDALAGRFQGEVVRISGTTEVSLSGAKITILSTPEVKSKNENSLGVLFETSEYAILITGDRNSSGEKALIRTDLLKDVDVLVAGHHGSKYATSDALLDAVTPEILMVSVGKDNSYGHPAPEVLNRADAHGCTVMRTDLLGTLVFRR